MERKLILIVVGLFISGTVQVRLANCGLHFCVRADFGSMVGFYTRVQVVAQKVLFSLPIGESPEHQFRKPWFQTGNAAPYVKILFLYLFSVNVCSNAFLLAYTWDPQLHPVWK